MFSAIASSSNWRAIEIRAHKVVPVIYHKIYLLLLSSFQCSIDRVACPIYNIKTFICVTMWKISLFFCFEENDAELRRVFLTFYLIGYSSVNTSRTSVIVNKHNFVNNENRALFTIVFIVHNNHIKSPLLSSTGIDIWKVTALLPGIIIIQLIFWNMCNYKFI